jgi:uncharacterized protein (DUF1697 family)
MASVAKASTRLFAFLRAINVGGRIVKMADLKALLESLKFTNVETYIASGNVVFEANGLRPEAVELKLGPALIARFKYDHTPFVRTHAALHAIATHRAFSKASLAKARGVYVGLLGGAPNAANRKAIEALSGADEELHVHGSEVYWASKIGSGQSKVSPKVLERAAGGPVTLRNVKTVLALAEKYPL